MADNVTPNNNRTSTFLPRFYRSDANKKFTQATIDQLVQPGTVEKINGFIGRQNAKASTGKDIFIKEISAQRQHYQLEPGLAVRDTLDAVTFFKDYQDYINQLEVFGGNVKNHARIDKQEFYSWDPHIDWDKFVNFQNYYWLPYGPDVINVAGQQQEIQSTFIVALESQGDSYNYVFSPDGLTRNPTLRLFKGQTYTFEINSPGNPFSIKTSRTAGNLDRYQPIGLDNFGVENGKITFTVPFNCPDVLYYVSEADIDAGGVLQVESVDENTKIDVEAEVVGKKSYTLSNGTPLSNGMKIRFIGTVIPESYETGEYFVEGVGSAIKLIKESDLALISQYTIAEAVLFDTTPFDKMPFSDATAFAGTPDYITINRASLDRNPWTRYNRWFHKDVVNASATYNDKVPDLDQSARAVRPIIEFEAGLKLFNFGVKATIDIDLIDSYTTDVFSTIEGAFGYNVDGIDLAQGHRILFTSDSDIFVKNKIYRVEFIDVQHLNSGSRQIHLVLEAEPTVNDVVLVKQGEINQGETYWFDGTTWLFAQQKTSLNQSPLFDLVDDSDVSFGNNEKYEGTTFKGTKLFSYRVGTGTVDSNLGFALSYKNINNIGDIVFDFNILSDTFRYKNIVDVIDKPTSVGYLIKVSPLSQELTYENGWKTAVAQHTQAAIRIYKNSNKTNNFDIDIFDDKDNLTDLEVRVYINGIRLDKSLWELSTGAVYKTVLLTTDITVDDVLTIRAFASQPINSNGHYEIPINLQNNPLNNALSSFTLGEVIDHVNSIVDNLPNFVGVYPGPGNLRDLGSITPYGTKFVQHSGPMGLSLYHITNEANNAVKAIEEARYNYTKFKRNFISIIDTLGVHVTNVVEHVNLILRELNKNKQSTAPYYFSDMIAYGSNVYNEYTVIDYRIKTYPLSETFNLNNLSNKAVYVYVNQTQLLYGHDYTFNEQGFVVISAEIANDDKIEIYEYDNTDGCFIPQTPTKLGIWPKYEPKIYTDINYITGSRLMIQGHDGSQVLAYGDYRDDLILEVEKRIYNNIKVQYDPEIFDIHDIEPSYVRNGEYSLSEFNETLAPQFYKWTSLIDKDFTKPLSYDKNNSLTFNYTGHPAPDGRNTPGYWRGIYRWLLDTDRPNMCPWEMLGFSEEPSWWTSVYGPSPYTSNNLPMWQDLANGLVKEPGTPVIKLEKFVRPFLLNAIPVNESGEIISPINAGLTSGVITRSVSEDFVFGDVSPVEAAWRRSSYYPFSVLIASLLLTPSKTIGLFLDRSRVIKNKTGQLIYKDTGLRIRPQDVVLPNIYSSTVRTQTSGIINYLVDYILSDNLKSYSEYSYNLAQLNVHLSHRLAAFTSKEKFKLLLDSKTPTSAGSVFVPQEDYDIILNVSSPVKKITYSGIIVTKLPEGFEVKGYSKTSPYFKYYPWIKSGPNINVGGISESFSAWTSNEQYIPGKVVKYSNSYYRVKILHVSTTVFNLQYFELLGALPINGGQNAIFRSQWDKEELITVPYGTNFRTVQEVVDFILGYGEYLKDQGFIFDDFNNNLAAITNWETSAKEFMFWTTQNWSSGQDKWEEWSPFSDIAYQSIVRYDGEYYQAIQQSPAAETFNYDDFVKLDGLSTVGSSVIALSPSAGKLTFSVPYTVVQDIKNPFVGYEIFKVDGSPLPPNFINSYRDNNSVSYAPQEQDGIYGATFYLVQKEQVVILKNNTMFNDTIYNPESGYRQERITVSGYVSTGWQGSFNSPGFIFDQANIQDWSPWTDYALGDSVKYKEFYYSAKSFIVGSAVFNSENWVVLDEKPTPKLLPNWTYKAAQFEDFYSLDSDNFDVDQQRMAQHLVGYQKRQYLENIIKDDVSEFKFYQGMIIEKGTQNSLNKLFDVLSADGQESLDFFEEWAIRIGQYGANAAFENIEFELNESLFKNNPQGFELVNNVDSQLIDFIIRQSPNDVYLKPLGYNNNPWPTVKNYTSYLRTPGYVRQDEVSLVLTTIDDIVEQDVDSINNGDYIWCGFEGREWNVYRYTPLNVNVTNASYNGSANELTLELDRLATVTKGTYIGVEGDKDVLGNEKIAFKGFYKVKRVSLNNIILEASILADVSFTEGLFVPLFVLASQRSASIDTADTVFPADTSTGELLWTDDSGDGKWATWTYKPVYNSNSITPYQPANGLEFGRNLALNKLGTLAVVSSATGELVVYTKATSALPWSQSQTISRPFLSTVHSPWSNTTIYNSGRTVIYNNKFYESIADSITAGTLPDSNSQAWKQIYLSDVVAMSTDGEWLAVGSPSASKVTTKYLGNWNISASNTYYNVNDIVNDDGKFYQAIVQPNPNVKPSTNLSVWKLVYVVPSDRAGYTSTLIEQGTVSLYKKDSNNVYELVSTVISPDPQSYEKFGSNLAFGDNVLFVSAVGHDDNAGRVYQLNYNAITYGTALYNPIGSEGTTIKITVPVGIVETGMEVRGVGFASGQTIDAIVSPTLIQLNAPPDSVPSGRLQFVITQWSYDDLNGIGTGSQTGAEYGYGLDVSIDSSTLIVAEPGNLANYDVAGNLIHGDVLGNVYVYKKTGSAFDLSQTIVGNIPKFGQSITVSDNSEYIAISSILFDGTNQDQGVVTVYKNINGEYSSYQNLTNVKPETAGHFGSKISFMNDYKTLVIYSEFADTFEVATVDNYSELLPDSETVYGTPYVNDPSSQPRELTTTFDDNLTSFKTLKFNSGRVDIYDQYANSWIFSESLPTTSTSSDKYGFSVSIGANNVFVSAPAAFDRSRKSGVIYEYSKLEDKYSWTILHKEISKIDLTKIKSAFLYNKKTNKLITYLDVIDPVQGKIPGIADQEIKFKTFYDPATYCLPLETTATLNSLVKYDDGIAWTKNKVGMLWWDLRTVKFLDSHDDDTVYRNSTWSTLFPGATVDVYEWVESSLKPDSWNTQADTDAGIALGISGTTLYGNNVYSYEKTYDNVSKTARYKYYYWVKNKKTIPNIPYRYMSAQDVSDLISNPRGEAYKYLALTGTNSFSLVNVKPLLEDTDTVLSVQYWVVDHKDQNIHSQWKIISNNTNTVLPVPIEEKWFDSLCGKDSKGRLVPDPTLPPKLKYGVENRPRQSMFVNRFEALKQFIEKTNSMLLKTQIVGQADLTILDSYETEPNISLGLYDIIFDTNVELRFANIGAFRQAVVTPVITDGRITDVTIVSKGNAYINAPYIEVLGTGTGAIIRTVINNKGQVTGVNIVSSGSGYSENTTLFIRSYSALVHSDSEALGTWSIYTYDLTTRTWSRIRSQSYDTRKYWTYADWYADGYNQYSLVDFSVGTFSELSTITAQIGQLAKIRTTNTGYWILVEKYNDSSSIDWTQSYKIVAQQNGTIQFKSALYKFSNTSYGFDGSLYDSDIFDNAAAVELRNILNCLKDKILIDELKYQYLDLFFTCVRYAHAEQNYLDWIFKTSFVKVQHNVGDMTQHVTYRSDNLEDFESYVSEVKPYRTKVREYVSSYSKTDTSQLSMTDFDLQPIYQNNQIVTINTRVVNEQLQVDNNLIATYPWKHWADNVGFVITELKLVDGGSGYHMEPIVRFTSASGTGATARAFITNGKVNRILLLTPGTGYLNAPTITIEGGLKEDGTAARAVAYIGNGVVRSNLIRMKFDRVTQTYFITELQETEANFVGTGSRSQFPLKWAPDVRVGKSTVTVNGVDTLRDDYRLLIVKSTSRGYTSYSGSIIFDTPPPDKAVISVTYLKDWSLLNAADRIQYYYNPTTGDLGKDLAQLMTGVDYGGVVINGLGLNVSRGWDSLPYYNDKWDSVDSTFDDYIVTVEADEDTFTLPYIPENGIQINAYHVKLYSQQYVSDGDETEYRYNYLVDSPVVTVTRSVTTNVINYASGYILTVPETNGIAVGDIVTVTLNGIFGYNTTVTEIVSNTSIKLDQIIFGNIPLGTSITFSRTLIKDIDYKISIAGIMVITTSPTIGNVIKISGTLQSLRIDDPYFDLYDGVTVQPNGLTIAPENAVMNTFTGNGIQDTIILPAGYTVNEGDKFIFRKSTSDGSVAPQEEDYDTALRGGDLAYTSATGLRAEDILVDGDGFVTPTSSPATEEVVPGQIFDAVSIKVFERPTSGSSNIKIASYVVDGIAKTFDIGQQINSPQAVLVKVTDTIGDSSIQTIDIDYYVNYVDGTVTFEIAPTINQVVSIYSFGFAGTDILDIDYFIGNGTTTEFITKAPWTGLITPLVYVNGEPAVCELFQTDNTYQDSNRVGIRFSMPPLADALINFVIVNGAEQTFSVTKTEKIPTNGSLTYELANKIGDSNPIESNMIVRVDQEILSAANNSYFIIKSNKLTYVIESTKFQPYSIDITDIAVYIGKKQLTVGTEYTVNLGVINIKLVSQIRDLYVGQQMVVSIIPSRLTLGPAYRYIPSTPPQIVFTESYDNTRVVEVTSSYKHDILDIQRTDITVSTNIEFTPNTIEYYNYTSISAGVIRLERTVLAESYVWVIKNGQLLVPSIDFKLNSDKQSITLTSFPALTDKFTLMTYSSTVLSSGISYMQFKDMLNRVHYKRLSLNKQTQLVNDLHYNDTIIELVDASNFDIPNPSVNKPGIIEIRGERIEYFTINGNVLGQLRRGTLGTGTPAVHRAGSYVQDIGPSETIPYNDTTVVEQITSNGSTEVNLTTFSPIEENTSWTYQGEQISSITALANDCVEVFVGGYRSVPWTNTVLYKVGDIVEIGSYTYRCVVEHTSTAKIVDGNARTFFDDKSNWTFFVGNIRLKKEPYRVHNVSVAPESPEGDVELDEEFTVVGTTKEIQLATPLTFGTKVTVIKRTGESWDSTTNVLYDSTKISGFLKASPGVWYTNNTKYGSTTEIASTFDSTDATFDNTNTTFDRG